MNDKKTIYDVAKLAGVSPATVSRAISGKGYVSEETRARILALAPDYFPRRSASPTERKSAGVIGVVVSQNYEYFFQNPTFSSVMQGISKVLTRAEHRILLDVSHPPVSYLISMYNRHMVDGYIFIGVDRTDTTINELCNAGIPTVLIGDRVDHISSFPCACVEVDDFDSARNLAEYLLTLGHKRIAFVSYSHKYASCYNRYLGYKHALEQSGIPFDEKLVVTIDDMSEKKAINLTKHLLYQQIRPTALITFNENLAMAAYKAVSDCGLSIPGDISVAGFDDNIFARYATPSLTTVWQPSTEKGEMAAKLLMDAIEKKEFPTKVITLEGMIIYRSSCSFPQADQQI